jgi:hypothetical protein
MDTLTPAPGRPETARGQRAGRRGERRLNESPHQAEMRVTPPPRRGPRVSGRSRGTYLLTSGGSPRPTC